jgi:hypothetical protein
MTRPLVVSVPHHLGKTEALRRIKLGLGRARTDFGHIISVDEETWNGDAVTLGLRALGQRAVGTIEVLESQIRLEVTLPWLLAKLTERFVPTIRKESALLLEKK